MASRFFALAQWIPGISLRSDTSDAALVGRVRVQDPAAFRTLFDRHAPAVWRFLRDLVDDGGFADEGVQETFVRAYDKIAQLREDTRVQGWLFGIARNVAMEHLRSRRRDRPSGANPLPDESDDAQLLAHQRDDALSPETLLLGRETEVLMAKALANLSDDRRAALLLRVDHGLGYEEIASAMGWTLPKVKNELHRARLQLREDLVRFHGGEP